VILLSVLSKFLSLATGSNYQAACDNLAEMMGAPLDQVKAAMRAAFNNPDRAAGILLFINIAEYLITGIPENLQQQNAPAPVPAPVAQAPASETPAAATDAPFNMFAPQPPANQPTAPAGGMDSLEFLRNSPQFAQLRQLVQTQPQLLQPVLAQLGQSNPGLLATINANQDAFLQMLVRLSWF
jgi:UV excision repair protein RAD23